jgi:O-antigen/teichoic acid export membrane protein
MKVSNNDSLKKRYFYKLSSGIISLPIQLIIQSIIPRSLGPVAYGQFTFLSNSFTQIVGFFDSGVSYAYYTKLSGDLKNKVLINYFYKLILILSLLLVLLVTSVFLLDFESYIWPDQQIIFIYMALFWALINYYSSTLNKTIDAFGLTSAGELIKIAQKFFSLFLILGLYFYYNLDLFSFFIYHYLIVIFFIIGGFILLKRNGVNLLQPIALTKLKFKKLTSYFWNYSSPMIVFSFIAMIVNILDYWFLQRFSGSVEQGYFGLSHRIAAICFIFTGAMTPLIIREFSVAFGNNNISKIRSLFLKNIPLLYTIAAAISIFLCLQGDVITQLIGGNEFEGAGLAISLMALYPIHQTYGQLSGSVFYSTGQTKLYRNIEVSVMITGLMVSFFLIGPQKFYGLSLGALGLAIKMLVMQFLSVNIQLYYNSKYLKLDFKKLFGHQLLIVLIFFLFAFSANYLSNLIFNKNLLIFLISGVIYLFLLLLLIYNFPILISVKKIKILKVETIIIKKIKRLLKNV